MSDPRVLIVGGGLAGLSCARRLHSAGVGIRLLESADTVGGRVRTDEVDGFLLDRGFQVLLTAYPECRRQLDYDRLRLCSFIPGAVVRYGGRFHTVVDPFRRPFAGLRGAFAPVGTLRDKLRVATLRHRLLGTDLDTLFSRPEQTTASALEAAGFSPAMIERFFRPFLAGIFLEEELRTSSRMFEFVFKMFSAGETAVPARGMEEIPRQLASSLPESAVRTSSRVVELGARKLKLASGEWIEGDGVVIASAPTVQCELRREDREVSWRSTACLYYSAPEPPLRDPILALDGEGRGPVNNLCVPSSVSPSCAPRNRALVSASVVDPDALLLKDGEIDSAVRRQLRGWFGSVVGDWSLVRVYRIHRALPVQNPGWLDPPERPVRLADRLWVCGDHRDNASIQGAMASGRRAAETVLEDLG